MMIMLSLTAVYTWMARPVPVPLRALTAGYHMARYSFMAEPVFQLRKWLIMIAGMCTRSRHFQQLKAAARYTRNVAGISLRGSYWTLLACVFMYGLIYFMIVRWKPFSMESQFDARLVQVVLLLFAVRSVVLAYLAC